MTNFDKNKVSTVLKQHGFGEIRNIVTGGHDGAYSTVYELAPKPGLPPMVVKLYKRDTANIRQVVNNEFNSMQKAYNASDAFPKPYACISFEDCADPRFRHMTETLFGIVVEKCEPVCFKKTPSESEVLKFAKDILEELVALHNFSGVRHGDIKLSNILINSRKNKYTLIDFNTSDNRFSDVATITAYTLIGSKYYLDPESLMNDQPGRYTYSPRSDIYALGMTLRLILNNNKYEYTLADNATNEQLINAKRNLGTFKSSRYSKELCELVSTATAFDRDDRFYSAQSMLDAVILIIDGLKSNAKPSVAEAREYSTEYNECTYIPSYGTDYGDYGDYYGYGDYGDYVKQNSTYSISNMSPKKKSQIITDIRSGNHNTALKRLARSNDKYAEFLRGCAYLGKKDMYQAERAFTAGKDKMSYYMLYILNIKKSPQYADECLEKAVEMNCPPAMLTYGYKLYKSEDSSLKSDGLNLIIRSAELKYLDAYRYLCKLCKRGEVSTNLISNIDTKGLTNTLSSFTD